VTSFVIKIERKYRRNPNHTGAPRIIVPIVERWQRCYIARFSREDLEEWLGNWPKCSSVR
ncbi:MAG: hypothetical protein ACOC9E_03490, partial [Chloroflexota bacterium]